MRVWLPEDGRNWSVGQQALIGRAAGSDIALADDSVLERHARLVAVDGPPAAWYLVTGGEAEVNGQPVIGGIKRLGRGRFSARLRLGRVVLECANDHGVSRGAAGPGDAARCPRCARAIEAGQDVVRCQCGARPVHGACFEGRCYRCGAEEQKEDSDG